MARRPNRFGQVGPPAPEGPPWANQGRMLVPRQFNVVPGGPSAFDGVPVPRSGDCDDPRNLSAPEATAAAIADRLPGVQLNARLPTYVHPDAFSTPFNLANRVDTNITDGGFVELLSFITAENQAGVIRGVGLQLESLAAFDDVQWGVVARQFGMAGYSDLTGPFGSLEAPENVYILLPANSRIALVAVSLTVGAVHLGRGRLTGWLSVTEQSSDGYQQNPGQWMGD